VENGPHGIVHLWTGQPSLQDPNGVTDMGVLATAAQDPIFFAHHSNIDRLWDIWLAMSGNSNLPDSGWRSQRWTFYNENRELVSISVDDVLDHEASLRYSYAPDEIRKELLFMQVKPTGKATSLKAVQPLALGLPPEGVILTGAPDTRSVALPPDHAANFKLFSAASTNQYVLHIEGVVAPAGTAPIVRVFIDEPDATASTTVEDPHFVGYFSVVPHHTAGEASAHDVVRTRNYVFELRANAEVMRQKGDAVSITLVPVAGEKDQPKSFNLTYKKAYLTVE
jgi:polyphenol oxidase